MNKTSEKDIDKIWADVEELKANSGDTDAEYSFIAYGITIDARKDVVEATLNSNTAYTVTNGTAGKELVVIIKNEDSTSHSATFIGGGMNPVESSHTVGASTYTIYKLTFNQDGFFVSLLSEESAGPFPSGDLGDLTILNGETVTISAGSIYDYNDIDIQVGGTLEIDDVNNEANLTEIYAKNFVIDGQILGRS